MPEQDNDSLEQFFRKAVDRPDVTFNEDDWKKLEARLDAADAIKPSRGMNGYRTVTAVVVAILLLTIGGVWLGTRQHAFDTTPIETGPASSDGKNEAEKNTNPSVPSPSGDLEDEPATLKEGASAEPGRPEGGSESDRAPRQRARIAFNQTAESVKEDAANNRALSDHADLPDRTGEAIALPSSTGDIPMSLNRKKIREELIKISSVNAERNKQEAVVELSGAEEADTPGVQNMVEEEHASDQEKHVAMPRLSLLLSFAPDFSSTSMEPYAGPGKAFGGVLHYHFKGRWSVSAGVIKNQKVYTGDGEDYKPPTGYWKSYTNGIIPESIDGSCSVLEFPLMVHYTFAGEGKNKWLVGAGSSSYLMQSESYRYTFSEPNPGAKEGWDSRGSSRFYFNMLNITAAYERQVAPGLSFGLEPYVKIPLEEIGWSNLRLYSMGASLTMRYMLIQKRHISPGAVRSRGPD